MPHYSSDRISYALLSTLYPNNLMRAKSKSINKTPETYIEELNNSKNKFFECEHCKTINDIKFRPKILAKVLQLSVISFILLTINEIINSYSNSQKKDADVFITQVAQLIFGITMLTCFYIVSNYIFRPKPTREIIVADKAFGIIEFVLTGGIAWYTLMNLIGYMLQITTIHKPEFNNTFKLTAFHFILLPPILMHGATLVQKINSSSAKLRESQKLWEKELERIEAQNQDINLSLEENESGVMNNFFNSTRRNNLMLIKYTENEKICDNKFEARAKKAKKISKLYQELYFQKLLK